MKNMEEITLRAAEVAQGLLDGTVDVKTAVEFNNSIGKLIQGQKCILAGQIARAQGMEIDMPFLQGKANLTLPAIKTRKLKQG